MRKNRRPLKLWRRVLAAVRPGEAVSLAFSAWRCEAEERWMEPLLPALMENHASTEPESIMRTLIHKHVRPEREGERGREGGRETGRGRKRKSESGEKE